MGEPADEAESNYRVPNTLSRDYSVVGDQDGDPTAAFEALLSMPPGDDSAGPMFAESLPCRIPQTGVFAQPRSAAIYPCHRRRFLLLPTRARASKSAQHALGHTKEHA